MKTILIMIFMCGFLSAQIKVIGDTTDMKALVWNRPIILLQYGGGTFDQTGGGIFVPIDSAIAEGTHAFDHPWSGKQWARLGYIGGELSAFQDITGTSLAISGSVTLPTSPLVIYALGGAPDLPTSGADIACDDGDRHFSQIYVPYTTTVTGIFYLIGSVGGTDSVIVDLYNAAGTLVTGGSSITAGGDAEVLVGTAATIQSVPFDGGTITLNPGSYFISVTFDGTTAKYAAYEATGSKFIADTDTGTFGTAASITPGTAYVDDEGPIGGIY